MTDRPILFQGAMVRALLAGTKTQTRRVVKPQPPAGHQWAGWCVQSTHRADEGCATWAQGEGPLLRNAHRARCPYGQPGDRLWVKETYFAYGRWETRFDAKKGRDAWHFIDMTLECGKAYAYAADVEMHPSSRCSSVTPAWWKRPAIFMPRAASRITLEITAVRVERLQSISTNDAWAEGIPASPDVDPVHEYRDLWESINGAGSWDANPWVWAVEFRRVQP